jgi:CBS domain-containing protein
MQIEDVMTDATCCHERDSARQAARLMKDRSIGFVPICNGDDEPIGAVTDRDIAIRIVAEGRSPDEKAATIMSHEVVSCRRGDDIRVAERLMREHQVSRVMVCDDDGSLVGVISLKEVAELEGEQASRTFQDVKRDQPTAH